MFGKNKVAAIVAEFVGTYILAMVVLALATRSPFPFFAASAAGLALGLSVLVFGARTGAQINPAVTLGLWTIRKVETTTAIVYIAAQALGGFVALKTAGYFLDTTLKNIAGKNVDWRVISAEAVGAIVLGVGVAAAIDLQYVQEKAAATVGLALALGILIASLGGNGIVNPAVAIGLHSWNVSYVVGPIIGTVVGMNLYTALFTEEMRSVRAVRVDEPVRTTKKPVRRTAKKR